MSSASFAKRATSFLLLFVVLFVAVLLVLHRPAKAAINQQISFQGKLTNTDGTNVTNGTYSILFSIYTVASGGSALWTETQGSVTVTDGIFRVALGSVTALPGSVDFNSSSLYLGIKVGADPEMTPRVQFTAAPYAFNSDRLGGIASTGFVQLGVASAQTDSSTNSAIFINKTSTGNQLQLQSTGVNVFTVSNAGDLTFGQNAAKTISIAQTASNAAGQNLSVVAGQGGAGAAANAGGNLTLQGGTGGGTNGNGGNVQLSAGAGTGTGTVGSVMVKNPTDSTTAFQVQNAAGTTTVFAVDTTNKLVNITGGVTINTVDNSIVRSLTTDFALGTVGSDVVNSNNQLELSDGTIPNSSKGTITTTAQPTTSAAIGAGAMGIMRNDGRNLIIRGGGTGMDVYDSAAGTFTNSAQVLNGNAGAGSTAFPRPDGRYRVIHGGGLTTTSLVDPMGVVAVGASVAVNASNAGTVAGKRPDGRFIFVNGGAATTQIYDPVADTFAAGPNFTAGTAGAGSLTLLRPDGQVLFIVGGASGNTQLYNPTSAAGNIGVFAAGPTMGTGCEINGVGSVALRRADGKYVVLSKANASTVYDPVANSFSCSTTNGPAGALGNGAHAIPLQNGTFLVLRGGATTDSYIYDPSTDTYTSHGTATTAVTTGSFSLMRHDGTWQILVGGSTTTNNYNTGLPMTGTTARYTSDDISTTALNKSSLLRWTAQYESPYTANRNGTTNTAYSTLQFFVRTATNGGSCTTALNAATDKEITVSGEYIRPTATTDNCIRVTVQFNRPRPRRISDDRGTWTGNNSTVMRLDYATPSLFDISIDNSTFVHKDAFNFSAPSAGSPAPQTETSGPVTTRVEAVNGQLQLPYGRLTQASGQIGVTGYFNGVVSGSHSNLTQAQTNDGTIVIARPNRTFVVIAALTAPAANASLYDPATQTFTAQSGGSIPTAANGAGGFAIKRPDGKYLVVLGNASTTTNIYDPDANTFAAGPTLSAAAGNGAFAIPNVDGSYTIVHGGGVTTTSMYDPVRNTTGTLLAGPASPTTAFNCGAMAIPRPGNNQYLVFFGAASGVIGPTTTSYYDAGAKTFSATTAAPTLTAARAVGCGAFSFQRPDGIWVIIEGGGGTAGAAQTATLLYNPVAQQLATGFALPTGTLRGGQVIPRPDGTFLIINGNATTATQLYIPAGGTAAGTLGVPTGSFVTGGPTLTTAVGAGSVTFQRPDGKWVIINGNVTATTMTYDAGWYADGQYLSEQSQVPALAANSVLHWKQSADNFVRMEARTAASQAALATAPYFSVGRPGSTIGNAGGETWVQVEINLRRDFPTYSGNLNGVYTSTAGMAMSYRQIALPTVMQYSINNGRDLLTLQDDGLNVLRITSEGNVYSSPQGGFYSGGADLAENYTSTEALTPGDVVVIEPSTDHSVKRSSSQYQSNILGVVSTAPGFVAGAFTENSYPIALVGRVPVKISNENGAIREGDYLTAASIPGYAMKATVGGRVLGVALTNPSAEDNVGCPAVGKGAITGTVCGSVMMFVNLTNYNGASIDALMTSDAIGQLQGSAYISDVEFPDVEGLVTSKQRNVLSFLQDLRSRQINGDIPTGADILAGRVNAVQEIISPVIVADIIRANKIQASSIEGLEVYTNKLSQLSSSTASLQQQNTSDAVALDGVTFTKGTFSVGLVSLGLFEAQGGIVVNGQAQFNGKASFAALVEFLSGVTLKGDLDAQGRVTFNNDTAGMAIIKREAQRVDVVFAKEYAATPVVNAALQITEVTLPNGQKEDKTITEARILNQNIRYVVSDVTNKGFSIVLAQPATEDISFAWQVVSVSDTKTVIGLPSQQLTPEGQ